MAFLISVLVGGLQFISNRFGAVGICYQLKRLPLEQISEVFSPSLHMVFLGCEEYTQ